MHLRVIFSRHKDVSNPKKALSSINNRHTALIISNQNWDIFIYPSKISPQLDALLRFLNNMDSTKNINNIMEYATLSL